MKKIIAVVLLITIVLSVMVCGCGNAQASNGSIFGNQQFYDSTRTFNRVIMTLPNGELIDAPVTSWTDFEDGDQLQITVGDVTYLVHSTNAVLIYDRGA